MRGYEVVMTTGTDEHGVNVERAAKNAGVAESEFVARMADTWRAWRNLWRTLSPLTTQPAATRVPRSTQDRFMRWDRRKAMWYLPTAV